MEDILTNNQNSTPVSTTNTTVSAHPDGLEQFENKTSNPEDLDSRWLRWKCLNCGYLYEGVRELKKCPRCGNENPDLFDDAD